MHTTIVQIVSGAGIHQAWTFDAKTKPASVSAAMRFCRRGWELDTTVSYADFTKVEKVSAGPDLTYVRLHC